MVSDVRSLEKLGENDLRITFETVCGLLDREKETERLRALCFAWMRGDLTAEALAERACEILKLPRAEA